MSLFVGFQNVYFKKDGSGNTIWFPWGTWRPGYSLSQTQARKAKQLQTTYFTANLLFGLLLILINMYLLAVGNLIITSIYFLYKLRSLTKGAPRVTNESTFKERLKLFAQGTGFKFLFFYFLALLLITIMFGFLIFRGVQNLWIIALFIFFACGTIYYGILLKYSRK